MKEHSSSKTEFVVSEYIHNSSSVTVKKNWQTPKLTELDTMNTELNPGSGTDGGLAS